jgi:ribosome-associated heat shock protein Hsp15
MDRMRLDKWLWAARFYKTRSLATHEIDAGRVLVGGQSVKPAREIAVDDLVEVRRVGGPPVRVRVRALSLVRGPAPRAALLYEETPDSVAAREHAAEMRRLAPEPARDFDEGRPTKRDRRQMERWRGR